MSVPTKQIFVNLPVKDLKRSRAFFEALGYSFNEQFTDENATCLVISDSIYAMLLVEEYFKSFISKDIANTRTSAEAILALATDSREHVDELADKALAAGGTEPKEPIDHGFMYTRSFEDPDGHLWEIFYMDESALEQ
ncbi:VOC family protein [Paenibacillus daejeonensis]|uniref:VOC family protein n=1 Tax=Paenibacillus daejeonensis TaxID=135193 RepID=UPI000360F4D4|nr:VOC family protein [Paenibacillus daejeonensis]